jgi:esterase/lipase superfamily enzyme
MNIEHHRWFSPALGHDMELKSYGHAGRPLLAFPPQNGRYYDFENFGMVEAVKEFVETGRAVVFAVDGIDWQSWTNQAVPPADRARRHLDYDRYVVEEVVPLVQRVTGRESMWTTGCSMGAFHAANFFFRHPGVPFDGVIAMSGLYQPRDFVGDYCDDNVYFNSPLYYLPNLNDPWYLERYRRSAIAIVVGQGAWEGPMIEDTRALERILREKGIPAIVDFWGHDVNHDWPWWRKMLPYYLDRLGV